VVNSLRLLHKGVKVLELKYFNIFFAIFLKNIALIEKEKDVSSDRALVHLLGFCKEKLNENLILCKIDPCFVYKIFRTENMTGNKDIDYAIYSLIMGTNTPSFSKSVKEFSELIYSGKI
jgi:hypothetical protein